MDLIKKNPNAELTSLRQQTDRPFDPFVEQGPPANSTIRQNPIFKLIETDEEILITAELPGIDSEDISMKFSGDKLIIKEKLKSEVEHKDENFFNTEENNSFFNHVISLPVPVDTSKIKSDLNKGLLKIHLAMCLNSEYFIG